MPSDDALVLWLRPLLTVVPEERADLPQRLVAQEERQAVRLTDSGEDA